MKRYDFNAAMLNKMMTMYMWMVSMCMSFRAAAFDWVSLLKVRYIIA